MTTIDGFLESLGGLIVGHGLEHGIASDGRTVWVDGPDGTIGRFGTLGIDVHTADTTGCLHCTHGPTTAADWEIFKAKVLEHHGVIVDKPKRFL